MSTDSLGELELEVLRVVGEQAPVTFGEVAEVFGSARGLARTTIHTVLERLRKKGYLTRVHQDGAYRYSPCESSTEVLTRLVGQFIDRTLGGSVKPFVAYLTQSKGLSPEEMDALRALVTRLDATTEEVRHE